MRKLQYALIKDRCTFKESLTLDLKPPLELDKKCALNYGPSIGRRVTLGAKLISSIAMKSACNGMKQMGLNLLKAICFAMLLFVMKSAAMKTIIVSEMIPKNMLNGPIGVMIFVIIRMT